MSQIACAKCGTPRPSDDARFCNNCGAPFLAPGAPAAPPPAAPFPPPPVPPIPRMPPAPARPKPPDLLGLLSFGVVLVVFGAILLSNTSLPTLFGNWIQTMTETETYARPPDALVGAVAWFFVLVGIAGLVFAVLRFTMYHAPIRAFRDSLRAIANLVFAYLVFLYQAHALHGFVVIGTIIIVGGIFIILSTLATPWLEKVCAARGWDPSRG